MTTTISKSQKFAWYNKARTAARNGKLDAKMVNRALSVLLASDCVERLQKYGATVTGCKCEQHLRHPKIACKHMIASMIILRATGATKTEPVQMKARDLNQISGVFVRMSDGFWTCAELINGGYNVHGFETIELARWWAKTKRHGTLVRWSTASGARCTTTNHWVNDYPEFFD